MILGHGYCTFMEVIWVTISIEKKGWMAFVATFNHFNLARILDVVQGRIQLK